jgi:hypothetical protein
MQRLMYDDIRENAGSRWLTVGIRHFDSFRFDPMTVVLGVHGVIGEITLQNTSQLAANHSLADINLDGLQFYQI